jgi:hypothetical protein
VQLDVDIEKWMRHHAIHVIDMQERRAVRLRVLLSGLGIGVVLASGAVQAHHAFAAEFDVNQPIVLKGIVSKAEWGNPHSWVYLDVKNDSGKTTTWAIECGAPNALLRRGWNKNSLPVGSEIVVDGYKAKNGWSTANAKDITFPNGQKLFMGSAGTGAPYEEKK